MPNIHNGELVRTGLQHAVGHEFHPRPRPEPEPRLGLDGDGDKVMRRLRQIHSANILALPVAAAALSPVTVKRGRKQAKKRVAVLNQQEAKWKAKTAAIAKARPIKIHTMPSFGERLSTRMHNLGDAAEIHGASALGDHGWANQMKLSHGVMLGGLAPTIAYQRHKLKPERQQIKTGVARARAARAEYKQTKSGVRKLAGKSALELLARNRHNIAPPAAGVGLAGVVGVHEDHKRKGMNPTRAAAATAAGAGGAGAFYGTGVHLRAKAREMDNVNMPGQSNSKRKAARKDHLASFGLHPNQPDIKQRMEANPRIARTWPEELAGSKYRRALGHMSGTRGKLLNAAAISVPSSVVLASGRTHGKKQVAKAQRQYGYLETKRSPVRTATLAAGTAVGAWGASRLHLAPAAAAGVRFAESKGHGGTARDLASGLRAGRDAVRVATGRGEAWLKDRVPGLGSALEPIPTKLRPHAATAAGAVVAYQSLPTKRRKFVPYGGQ